MQTLQRDLSAMDGENEMLLAVRESARILFGLDRIAFLFVKPDKPVLSGADFDGQPALLKRLEIRLEPAHSLAAAVALGDEACSTFDEELPASVSLVDVQIARAIGSEGLLYVPMRSGDRVVGVMAFGLTVSQHARIQRHLAWMTSYAQLAAACIETCREKRDNEQKLELTLSSRFEQRARKAVHEAGNPLSIIKNYLKIVSQKLPDDNDVHQELEILREEIDRVAHILQHLTDLSEAPPAKDTVDINAVIEGMLALYSESLFTIHGIVVEKRLDPALSAIPGDRDNVKQILLNLWKNAAEAMPEGGRFVISTRGNVIHNGRPHAEICLSDSGPGLPQDVLQRLFQPLDPDRRPGHSGIGLSIVASLVERLGGQVKNQHIEGQGASFFVLLPQFEGIEK
jgi:nitrogen-specific signal transduction histidine kinase